MKEALDSWWNQIKEATGDEQRNLFVRYCSRLVELKEQGKLSEEEAAYKIVGAIQFDNLTDSPECDAIFDTAGTTELPRTSSYAQAMGKWDEKTADQIKQKEWRDLVVAIENAKNALKIS